jgi:xylan 1,4-beta-xylosidase
MPELPLFWTEWNVPGQGGSRDTIYVGPALANTVRECDGKVDALSFWTFSDVFEEGGPIPEPFMGQFGLRAKGGINKPSFYAFALLHRLGDQRIAAASTNAIVTKTSTGALAIAAWNLVDPGQQGKTHTMEFAIQGVPRNAKATLEFVDSMHGNVLPHYAAMGKPVDPTEKQVEELNRETALGAPEQRELQDGTLKVDLTPDALVLVTVQP